MSAITSPAKQAPETPDFGDARLPERFWEKATVTEQGCWQWSGTLSKGYGRYSNGGRAEGRSMARAHRHAYMVLVGSIGEGLTLDHLCRNRACVNPAHLEPVTNAENQRRSPNTLASRSAAKTHCPADHPYDAENTLVSGGRRYCRTCRRARRVKTPALATP